MNCFRRSCYAPSLLLPLSKRVKALIALSILLVLPLVSLTSQETEDDGGELLQTETQDEQTDAVQATPSTQRSATGDWGVSLDAQDSTRFADHLDNDIRGRAAILGLWARRVIPFSAENELDLSAEGSYNWSRSDIYVNLDLLRVTARLPEMFSPATSVETSIGRFPFRDPSGLVLNHTGDGILTRLSTPRTRTRLGAMYTGLQLNPVSSIRMSATDRQEEYDDDETFGPRRVVGIIDFRFPELIGRQSLSLALLGQLDARDADDNEDTLHSGYAVLGLDGPIVGQLFGDVVGAVTLGSYDDGNDDDTYFGYMGSARLRLFLPQLLSSRISLRGVVMSNDDDPESFDAFLPISRSIPGTVISVPLENIIFGELRYSLRPFASSDAAPARRTQFALTGRTYFTASDDPPGSEPFGSDLNGNPVLLQPDPDGNYIGTEVVLNISARVRSDLGIGLTAGVFFPGTGSNGVFSDDRKEEFVARVELSTRL